MVNHKNTEFPEVYNVQVQTMLECMAVCVACARKCLEEGHKKTAALCTECSEACAFAVKALSGRGVFARDIMEICETVCENCAEECHKMDAKHCKECAEVCRRCVQACVRSNDTV